MDNEIITIELSEKIANKKVLVLPISHIGEWLFFNKRDVDLPIEYIAQDKNYLKYKNKNVLIAQDSLIKEKKAKEITNNYNEHGYVYHFTNYDDFIKIMKCRRLFCRNKAKENGACFSHNNEMTQSVMEHTDDDVTQYARLALSSNNPAFKYFYHENYNMEKPSCLLYFSILKVAKLNDIRVSDKVANRKHNTYNINNYEYENKIKKICELSRIDKAELLIYKEVPINCIDKIEIGCPKKNISLIKNEEFRNIERIALSDNIKIKILDI